MWFSPKEIPDVIIQLGRSMENNENNIENILIYQSQDGQVKVDVRFVNETAWLSLDQMATLFGRDKSTISRHIKKVFEEGELIAQSVVANFATTATDGKVYQVDYYNLEKPMYMRDWVQKLRLILTMNEKNILEHAGTISHKLAVKKATQEYFIYKERQKQAEHIDSIKQLDYDIKQICKRRQDDAQ